MALGRTAKLGFGTAAVALAALASVGSAPTPATQLPTVTVYHHPT